MPRNVRARAVVRRASVERKRPSRANAAVAPSALVVRRANVWRPAGAPTSPRNRTVHPAARGPLLERTLLDRLAAERAKFFHFVRRRVASDADAHDFLQQALVRATEKIASVRDPDRVEAWFYRLLRRTIADARVAHARRSAGLALLGADLEEASHEEVAACACSLGLLDRLRPEYALMLQRIDVDEEPIAEVSRSLGLTTNNAGVRLHRARKALRKALSEACGTSSMRACSECACEPQSA
jgi:RNA polymerase sigma factor (sigma-70 family)